MELSIRNLDNAEVGTIDLADEVFGLPVRADILARVVNWQLAKRRAGTHKVKERHEIARRVPAGRVTAPAAWSSSAAAASCTGRGFATTATICRRRCGVSV